MRRWRDVGRRLQQQQIGIDRRLPGRGFIKVPAPEFSRDLPASGEKWGENRATRRRPRPYRCIIVFIAPANDRRKLCLAITLDNKRPGLPRTGIIIVPSPLFREWLAAGREQRRQYRTANRPTGPRRSVVKPKFPEVRRERILRGSKENR